jgi:hypothetical protein
VRSEVSLKIRNVWDAGIDSDAEKKGGGGGGGGSMRQVTVKEGERIDGIAAREMGDASRWPEIAAENNLDDPIGGLKAGMNLKIPE